MVLTSTDIAPLRHSTLAFHCSLGSWHQALCLGSLRVNALFMPCEVTVVEGGRAGAPSQARAREGFIMG